MNQKSRLDVYYNSACPVCRAGIEIQKNKMQGCAVNWKDVHTDNTLVDETGSDLEFVRERLHVLDAEGRLHTGFAAFLEIWRHSPGEQWKASLLGLPLLRHFCSFAYNRFAAGLYRWNRRKHHW